MTQHNELARSLRVAIVFGLAGVIAAPVAFAQDEETTDLDAITVTGSRIRQSQVETAAPVTVITRDEIKKQGFRNVADILQNISAAGTPPISRASPLSAGEAVGGQFISLRNLGASRTLVLLNGKRLGITTGGIQDISIIPASSIERVEVLKDGASSIYGSDAIAGVINLITRQNFEGIETNAYYGEFSEGDGETKRFDVSFGAANDTSSVTVILDYGDEQNVRATDRDFTAFPLGPAFPDRNFTTVGQFGGFVTTAATAVPGLPTGTRVTLRPGGNPLNRADYVRQQSGPTDNQFTTNTLEQTDLRTPLTQRQMFVSAHHDFSETLKIKAEALYSGRDASRQVAGFPLQGGANGPSPLSANSIFNPFATIGAGPNGTQVATGTAPISNWWRRTWEQPRISDSSAETFRTAFSLEGSFSGFDRDFFWDVNAFHHLNRTVQKTLGNTNITRLRNAVGPSFINAGGQAQCGTPTAPIALGVGPNSCVPFNPFLSFGVTGRGGLTDNALLQEYLFQRETASGETTTTVVSANITGQLFTLPAGDLSFAVGAESRRERGEFVPDALAVTGESTNLSSRETSGSYGLEEIYAEFRIPLLADMAFAKSLDVTLASRYSDFDTFGDTTNSKLGIEYRPTDDLLFRGTFAEGFRAPTISNLFSGGSQTFAFYTDPCDPVFGQGSNPTVRANCARDISNIATFRQQRQGFVPVQGPNEQTPVAFFQGTGNAGLSPETSESRSLGVVYSPGFVEGLNLSLDYWFIDIEDLIIGDTIGQILGDCYVTGLASRCSPTLFTRDATSGIVNSANIGLRNAGYNETEGYDFGATYRYATEYGDFGINWQSTYTARDEFKSSNLPADLPSQNVSFGSSFRIRSNATLNWSMGDWGASWTTRYFSAIKETCLAATLPGSVCTDPNYVAANPSQTRPLNRTGSVSFNDVQVRYNLPWDASVSVGANNVGERIGPTLYSQPSANTSYYGGFDIGRFVYMTYNQKF